MLETKFVQNLQSKPYHVRAFIFLALMGVLGVGIVGYTLNSMRASFVAAIEQSSEPIAAETSYENKIAREENGKVIVLGPQKSPSLVSELEANISQMGAMIGNSYKNIADYMGRINIDVSVEKKNQ